MHVADGILDLLGSLRDHGVWGALGILALYVAANFVIVPATMLTTACGYALGFTEGALVAAIGRVVAGVLSFSCSRRFFRRRIASWIDRRNGLRALDQALFEGGFRAVVLIRLSPLFPSASSNWIFGATRVSLRDFVLGTAVGTLPSTLVQSFIGSGLRNIREAASDERGLTGPEWVLLGGGVIATVAAFWVIGRLARRARAGLIDLRAENDIAPGP